MTWSTIDCESCLQIIVLTKFFSSMLSVPTCRDDEPAPDLYEFNIDTHVANVNDWVHMQESLKDG